MPNCSLIQIHQLINLTVTVVWNFLKTEHLYPSLVTQVTQSNLMVVAVTYPALNVYLYTYSIMRGSIVGSVLLNLTLYNLIISSLCTTSPLHFVQPHHLTLYSLTTSPCTTSPLHFVQPHHLTLYSLTTSPCTTSPLHFVRPHHFTLYNLTTSLCNQQLLFVVITFFN